MFDLDYIYMRLNFARKERIEFGVEFEFGVLFGRNDKNNLNLVFLNEKNLNSMFLDEKNLNSVLFLKK